MALSFGIFKLIKEQATSLIISVWIPKRILHYTAHHASRKVKIALTDIDGILRGKIFRRKISIRR